MRLANIYRVAAGDFSMSFFPRRIARSPGFLSACSMSVGRAVLMCQVGRVDANRPVLEP